MYSFDSKEINEHKAEDPNGLQFGRKLAREERKFGEIRSFVANDKMGELARPWSSSIWKDECSIVLHEILLHVLTGRCHSGNSQTILGRNLYHDLQHQTYHDMLYRFMNVWYHCLCVAMCFVFYCFIFRAVGFAGRGDPIKRLEYPCLTPTVVTSSQLQCFSMLQLIEHYDVKIFLILALFDWIAATFLSDPHPSNTTGSLVLHCDIVLRPQPVLDEVGDWLPHQQLLQWCAKFGDSILKCIRDVRRWYLRKIRRRRHPWWGWAGSNFSHLREQKLLSRNGHCHFGCECLHA